MSSLPSQLNACVHANGSVTYPLVPRHRPYNLHYQPNPFYERPKQGQYVYIFPRRRTDKPPLQLPTEVLVYLLSFVANKRDLIICMAINRHFYHCAQRVHWRYPVFGNIHLWLRFRRMIDASSTCEQRKRIADSISILNFSVIAVIGDRSQRRLITEAALGCSRITVLNLYRCDWINDEFVFNVARSCRALRVLNMSYCASIGDDAVLALTGIGSQSWVWRNSSSPHLASPTLMDTETDGLARLSLDASAVSETAGDETLGVEYGCPMMDTLILRECPRISNKALEWIARSNWQLRRLNLSHCKRIQDAGLKWISADPYDMDKSLDEALLTIPKSFKALASRALDTKLRAEKAAMDAEILYGSAPAAEYSVPTSLAMPGNAKKHDSTGDQPSPVLAHLRTRGGSGRKCKTLSHNGFSFLTHLILTKCVLVTDHGIEHVARGCSRLRSLNLSGLGKICNWSIKALREGCPRITMLDLIGCYRVTAAGAASFNVASEFDGSTEVRYEIVSDFMRAQAEQDVIRAQLMLLSGDPGPVAHPPENNNQDDNQVNVAPTPQQLQYQHQQQQAIPIALPPPMMQPNILQLHPAAHGLHGLLSQADAQPSLP
ncbi:hypothetical protein BC831DRAFT_482372 [Entophlyctis helioformis]|nr:hypothetical protein BC831DRAFT_482372 [Entophlyctis helioformis]